MFYSDTLLSKTGPLARVWLAANIERKLTKSNILQQDIGSSVNAIVDPGQAPMALRLSGQLLLGVVRIYSRKTRYLLDDCNDALLKIKMAFRPGNVDLPADQSHTVNPASLTLPEVLTELDLLAPMLDPALLLADIPELARTQDPTLLDWGTSQLLPDSMEQSRREYSEPLALPDDDLDLDLGLDDEDITIEKARRAPTAQLGEGLAEETSKLYDDDLDLDLGGDEPVGDGSPAPPVLDDTVDIPMGGMDDYGVPVEDDTMEAVPLGEGAATPAAEPTAPRDTASPLSSIRSSVARNLETTFRQETTIFDPEDESIHQAQRAKRRKVLESDIQTEIQSGQFREQQNDRSKILKPASFLPKDPVLLALMNMQKSGAFVSSILGNGRAQGWAPELRGIMSIEVIRRSGDLKRKRDSGVADLEDDEQAQSAAEKTPQLEFEQDEDVGSDTGAFDVGGDTTLNLSGEQEEIAPAAQPLGADDDDMPIHQDEEGEDQDPLSPVPDNFDDTTMPLLHPADSGPVSLGTKHAVYLLRERFGPLAETDAAERQRKTVRFQDMLPERRTTKADATKMFFEVLVLATKDAVKVEQKEGVLGGEMRIRGKRGLWGSWAEEKAGGEIATQTLEEGGVVA
ncbi:hypothetical protein K402DRAFT_338286 [Aulographum hederae CBS 113979]|uniref:Double-strand-break repair protein rad21 n=1 Tax=Aulographum hederae CBS 113979 TaxID=1176131 RepID=A0A6G1GRZ5_9PEZI|nr:hypothetical protein K402DRAFT_338286 [Aulographum hederae CBS 113979]